MSRFSFRGFTDKPKTSAGVLRATVEEALRALDRLERTIRVRPGDDPRVLGLVRGAKDAVRAVGRAPEELNRGG